MINTTTDMEGKTQVSRTDPPKRAEVDRPEPARQHARASIEDFLTDGSLVTLCEELSRLTGASIRLRDADGRRIVSPPSGPGWVALGPESEESEEERFELFADGEIIGALCAPRVSMDNPRLRAVLTLLASTVTEVCDREVELQHRLREMSVMYRLSSLLARAASVDEVLRMGLDSALEVLELDAGTVVLLPETADGGLSRDEADLVHKASRNLSHDWLMCPLPLSRDRVFDRLALAGDVVAVEDLSRDARVAIADRAAAEGLASFLSAGLIFRDRPIGVIRLYAKRTRAFPASERRLLQSIAQQLAVAVEQARLLKIQEEDKRIQGQLQLAADVQRRMLPRMSPASGRFDLSARWVPTFELAGDFYDFIDLEGRIGIAVGDVVGKGIAAALLMASARAWIRAYSQESADVRDVVARVNLDLCRDTLVNEFVTLWYAIADESTLDLSFCSAGHEPPFVARRGADGGVEIIDLRAGGMVAGVEPEAEYERGSFRLQPGDTLVACTDGLIDSRNFSGDKFGRARLTTSVAAIARDRPDASATEVIEHVLRDVRHFAGLADRDDDLTLVVLRVRE